MLDVLFTLNSQSNGVFGADLNAASAAAPVALAASLGKKGSELVRSEFSADEMVRRLGVGYDKPVTEVVYDQSTPVDSDGSVYIGGARSSDKTIWKLNSSFVLQWSTAIGAETQASHSAIDGNGNVYMCYGTYGGLVKLNADGEIQWTKGASANGGVVIVD